MKRIVIATDGSESALEAVELGLDLASEQAARAFVVHVAPRVDALPYAGFTVATPTIPHELGEHDRKPLQEASELAAVGSRGHGAIASALIGSVSRAALHESRRPVLIARGAQVMAAAVC